MSGVSNYLAKLTPIQAGESLRDVLTAERLNAIQGALMALARGENVVSG